MNVNTKGLLNTAQTFISLMIQNFDVSDQSAQARQQLISDMKEVLALTQRTIQVHDLQIRDYQEKIKKNKSDYQSIVRKYQKQKALNNELITIERQLLQRNILFVKANIDITDKYNQEKKKSQSLQAEKKQRKQEESFQKRMNQEDMPKTYVLPPTNTHNQKLIQKALEYLPKELSRAMSQSLKSSAAEAHNLQNLMAIQQEDNRLLRKQQAFYKRQIKDLSQEIRKEVNLKNIAYDTIRQQEQKIIKLEKQQYYLKNQLQQINPQTSVVQLAKCMRQNDSI